MAYYEFGQRERNEIQEKLNEYGITRLMKDVILETGYIQGGTCFWKVLIRNYDHITRDVRLECYQLGSDGCRSDKSVTAQIPDFALMEWLEPANELNALLEEQKKGLNSMEQEKKDIIELVNYSILLNCIMLPAISMQFHWLGLPLGIVAAIVIRKKLPGFIQNIIEKEYKKKKKSYQKLMCEKLRQEWNFGFLKYKSELSTSVFEKDLRRLYEKMHNGENS